MEEDQSGNVNKDRKATERERRELAQRHRGEVVEGSGRVVEPHRLEQVVSLRFDPDLIGELRNLASQRGTTISNLLREAAARLVQDSKASPYEVEILQIDTGFVRAPSATWGKTSSAIHKEPATH